MERATGHAPKMPEPWRVDTIGDASLAWVYLRPHEVAWPSLPEDHKGPRAPSASPRYRHFSASAGANVSMMPVEVDDVVLEVERLIRVTG